MKLYGFSASPNTWQVRALAAHIGVPLDFQFVDLTKGEQKTPEYLAINPTGRTPALTDGEFKLWETLAIMQYVAEQKPNALWPRDARARADIARWQSWNLSHWNRDVWVPALNERLVKKVLNLGAPDAAVLAKADEAYKKEATMLDAHLATHKYLVGNELTIADFAAASPLFYAKEAEFRLDPYPHMKAWFEKISALPCWRETAPQPRAAAA
jgi:glutathione S-transferase